ncbi:MAG: hypothetical protein Q8P46_06890 [Hyphomicrobiales bacterium]|nr:hypothetical protein [Hyphomicrobiales bacterium]
MTTNRSLRQWARDRAEARIAMHAFDLAAAAYAGAIVFAAFLLFFAA